MRKFAILLAAVLACSDGAPRNPVAGTYVLDKVAGAKLPQPAGPFFVEGGAVTLHEDSTFIDVIRVRFGRLDGPASADTLLGTWLLYGDKIAMNGGYGYQYELSWKPGSASSTWYGAPFLYVKRR